MYERPLPVADGHRVGVGIVQRSAEVELGVPQLRREDDAAHRDLRLRTLDRPELHDRAVKRAENWMREHTRGSGGIGAIYPAMANSVRLA